MLNVDTEEIFKAALAKFPVINIEAREEIRRLRKLHPDANEGNRLSRDLSFLMLELSHPPFEEGDSMAKNDLDNRFSLTFREIVEYAKPYLKTDPILQDAFKQGTEAETVIDQISAFDLILQFARKAHEKDAKKNERTIKILEGNISYDPENDEIFYKGELVSSPKINTKERAVWKLLYESKASPRRATFALLRECKNIRDQLIFPRIGDEITSDISKWNKKFKTLGVSVLSKDGESIKLEELQLEKK